MTRRRTLYGVLLAALLLGASAAAIAARRPDLFTRPQFWAEDGMEWYARAYNLRAWYRSVLMPYGGYLQTFPRLAGLAAQAVGLGSAPLLLAVLALAVQSIAPVFLLTDRFEEVIPGRARRLVFAALLVAVPNLMEVHVNVTNSHVHLALLAFLVLIAEAHPARAWRAFDVGCLLLSGLSGPFCILLVPVAALCWWHARDRWSGTRFGCVLAASVLQFLVLSQRGATSRGIPVAYGASLGNLLDILGGQIFTGGLAGLWIYVDLYGGAFARHPWLPIVIGAAGLAFVLRAAVVTGSFALRAFLLFAALHLGAALSSPLIFGDAPLWELLQRPAAGQRYWYFSTLAFLAVVLWSAAADPRRTMRALATVLLGVLLLVGIPRDWRLPPNPDLGFPAQVERFAAAPPRQKVELLTLPEGWRMVLFKKP